MMVMCLVGCGMVKEWIGWSRAVSSIRRRRRDVMMDLLFGCRLWLFVCALRWSSRERELHVYHTSVRCPFTLFCTSYIIDDESHGYRAKITFLENEDIAFDCSTICVLWCISLLDLNK